MLWRLGIRWSTTRIDSPGRKKNEGNLGERHFVVIFKLIPHIHNSWLFYRAYTVAEESKACFGLRRLKVCLQVTFKAVLSLSFFLPESRSPMTNLLFLAVRIGSILDGST